MDVGHSNTPVIQPKTKGAGIMESDLVEQHQGFLSLSDEDYSVVVATVSDFLRTTRFLLQYGAKEGYWIRDNIMKNINDAV